MRRVYPEVHVVARTAIDHDVMREYLQEVGGVGWFYRMEGDEYEPREALTEFAGRLCYRSWEPGLNPNIRQIRTDHEAYLHNILEQRHGSVLEHVSYSFVFQNVSRVLTHELVRHRPGVGISQESMRYVRLDDIPFWFPDWARNDPELYEQATQVLAKLEWFQKWMASRWGLDQPGVSFADKKAKTSFMRRFAPEGVATSIMWTANLRTIRHVIEVRTAPGAEEEIRFVFGKVARIMTAELPALFGDFSMETDTGAWVPSFRKV